MITLAHSHDGTNALRRLFDMLRPASRHPMITNNHRRFGEFDQDTPLSECTFAVIDTELTGLNSRKDEIVSIGAVRVKNLSINPADSFYAVVCPEKPLPKFSTLIHRITPQCVEQAPKLEEVLPNFLNFLGDSLIVAHHVELDMGFLNKALKKHLGGRLITPCLDTMRLARAYHEESWRSLYDAYDNRISYNLGDLAAELGLPRYEEHNAYWDAMQAAYLFVYLIRKLDKGRIRTIGDLYRASKPRRWC